MTWLRKVPGSRRAPAGLEWRLLRRLPWIALLGTVLPTLASLAVRLVPAAGSLAEAAKHVQTVDAYVIGTLVVHWTAVVTVAIGCVIVMIMKGPAYEADAYPVPDRDAPRED